MVWGLIAAATGSALGGYLNSKGASKAGEASEKGTVMSIAEMKRQFDVTQELLAPYVGTGVEAIAQQRALLGLAGPEREESAIGKIARSPQFEALTTAGENAILQNASATGGLRGGNVQRALAEYRPQILNSLINQRYQNLAGLSAQGQNAAAGTGAAALQTGSNISSLLARNAGNQANVQLSKYGTYADVAGNIGGLIGSKF